MYVINYNEIEIDENATFVKKPIQILDRQVQKLRNKEISMVKMLWKHHGSEDITWELEKNIWTRYPHLL